MAFTLNFYEISDFQQTVLDASQRASQESATARASDPVDEETIIISENTSRFAKSVLESVSAELGAKEKRLCVLSVKPEEIWENLFAQYTELNVINDPDPERFGFIYSELLSPYLLVRPEHSKIFPRTLASHKEVIGGSHRSRLLKLMREREGASAEQRIVILKQRAKVKKSLKAALEKYPEQGRMLLDRPPAVICSSTDPIENFRLRGTSFCCNIIARESPRRLQASPPHPALPIHHHWKPKYKIKDESEGYVVRKIGPSPLSNMFTIRDLSKG